MYYSKIPLNFGNKTNWLFVSSLRFKIDSPSLWYFVSMVRVSGGRITLLIWPQPVGIRSQSSRKYDAISASFGMSESRSILMYLVSNPIESASRWPVLNCPKWWAREGLSSPLQPLGEVSKPFSAMSIFQSTLCWPPLLAADFVQDLYVKELRAFKPTPLNPNDSEGHVQQFSLPKARASPEESDIAKDLKSYDSQVVEVEGQEVGGRATSTEEDWFEDDDESEEAHAAHWKLCNKAMYLFPVRFHSFAQFW